LIIGKHSAISFYGPGPVSMLGREEHGDRVTRTRKFAARAGIVVFILVVANLVGFQGDQGRHPAVNAAADADVGFQDMNFNTSGVSDPTGQKPQSKLWYNDGLWWGDFYSKGNGAYHIYALDWETQVWSDTGIALDDRENSWADVLWDGTFLYVASGTKSGPGRLYRYTYDANPLDGKPYKLSPGFPVQVTSHGMEALVMAKDGTGSLWITYTNGSKVYVAHSAGSDSTWTTPYVLPVPEASGLLGDDISSIVAYDGHIGVMWSNQNLKNMVFATHVNGALDSQWQGVSSYTPSADDHINLKSLHSDSAGNVFAVVKTSFSNVGEPAIVLLACTGADCKLATSWEAHTVYARTASSQRTRPILLLDSENHDVYVFMATSNGGPIRYKKSSIDALNFPTGGETIFIDYGSGISDPTSTKQNLTSSTGLVVAASSGSYYYHNCLTLTSSVECPDLNPIPKLAFSATSYTVAEGGGMATIEVRRVGALDESVAVDYAISSGTAESGKDYAAVPGTLTFGVGVTSETFTIDILDDGLDEVDETVLLTLSNPTNLTNPGNGATLGAASSSTLTINDDEEPGARFSAGSYNVDEGAGSITIDVVLDIPSILQVDVDYATEDDTAVAGSDYTTANSQLSFAPGEKSKSFIVPILEDDEYEANERVRLTLTGAENTLIDEAILTIKDNEPRPLVQFESAALTVNEDGGEATVFVTLSKTSGDPVSVDYATTDNGTATAGADYLPVNKTLSFAPGERRKSFTVTIFDNGASEPGETVELLLSNPQETVMGSPDTAVITILDDEIVPTAQFTTSYLSLKEGAITVPIEVTLSAASAKPISVDYTMLGITASPGGDFRATSAILTFIPGVTSQNIPLEILDDSAIETNEKIQLSLSGPFHAELGVPEVLNINLVDDDSTYHYLPFVSGISTP
jgi:hypothetical protein